MTNEEALEHFRKLAEQDKERAREAHALPSCPSCGRCNHCGRGGYARPYYVPMPYWRHYEPFWVASPDPNTFTVSSPSITYTLGTTSTGILRT